MRSQATEAPPDGPPRPRPDFPAGASAVTHYDFLAQTWVPAVQA